MFKIQDGRDSFYQWDLDRKLIVEDPEVKEIHFCNRTDDCSLVCETYTEDGLTLVNVPNILLTTDWKIRAYGYAGYTKYEKCFEVVSRTKPADYIYTETEVRNYEAYGEALNRLWDEVNYLSNHTGIEGLENGGNINSIQQKESNNSSWATSNDIVKKHIAEDDIRIVMDETLDSEAPDLVDRSKIKIGAFNKYATMWGGNSQASGSRAHAEGGKTLAIDSAAHSEGTETFAAGKHSHAEGLLTSAIGNAAHSEGNLTIAEGDYSHAEGLQTKALFPYSHAEGYYTQAGGYDYGNAAHAEGYYTQAYAEAAHSEGKQTQVDPNAIAGHAEGLETIVKPDATAGHAEGYQTRAIGKYSHAEGENNGAHGIASHAEGKSNRAIKDYSHAQGVETETQGVGSMTMGKGTIAYSNYGLARGRYNLEDIDGLYVDIVGNGDKTQEGEVWRSNCYTLDWYGRGWFKRTVEAPDGFILKSPNGTRYQITVDDSGKLSTTELA